MRGIVTFVSEDWVIRGQLSALELMVGRHATLAIAGRRSTSEQIVKSGLAHQRVN